MNVDERTRELFFAHLYSTTSTKVVHHWFQMIRSGSFEFYNDAGFGEFLAIPEYRLEKIRVPVALIHGGADLLSDVSWMCRRLRQWESWEIPEYEHICPLIRKDVPEKVSEQRDMVLYGFAFWDMRSNSYVYSLECS